MTYKDDLVLKISWCWYNDFDIKMTMQVSGGKNNALVEILVEMLRSENFGPDREPKFLARAKIFYTRNKF